MPAGTADEITTRRTPPVPFSIPHPHPPSSTYAHAPTPPSGPSSSPTTHSFKRIIASCDIF